MSMDFAAEDDWERHRAFLAVLREGSLAGAARSLDLAHPTVRRRIAELEQRLGVTLFTRAPDGLRPTDVALSLRDPAEAMALAAAAFTRTAQTRSGEIAGLVRVSASDIIAVEVLPPVIAELRRSHPALNIALSPSNRNEDLLRREADIAVRMVRPAQDALVARYIGAIELGLHARAEVLDGHRFPETLDDVRAIGLIGVETDNAVLRGLRAQGITLSSADFTFRTDSDLAQLTAIRAGVGIGVCQVPLAARPPHPPLIRVLPEIFSVDLDTWVVMHEDLRTSAPVRAAFDALVVGLNAYLAQPSDAASIAVAAPRNA
ncbi:MAG: LysR family transcriptional regulator [Pseudomonadota bacterium]|uniref:LysR family transcriptional regulator n=1 Tax=Sphingomonas sp. ERG5 TaxID=1381597 RepID=UPI00054C681F|nr:LysR family transcriptional regulator [Sphingomonas sp. ERG5]